jgi:hypothetical protein
MHFAGSYSSDYFNQTVDLIMFKEIIKVKFTKTLTDLRSLANWIPSENDAMVIVLLVPHDHAHAERSHLVEVVSGVVGLDEVGARARLLLTHLLALPRVLLHLRLKKCKSSHQSTVSKVSSSEKSEIMCHIGFENSQQLDESHSKFYWAFTFLIDYLILNNCISLFRQSTELGTFYKLPLSNLSLDHR